MGILHQVQAAYTGGLAPAGGSKGVSTSDAGDPQDQTGSDYGSDYGTSTLKRVKRATKRINGNGNGKRSDSY